MGTFYNTKIPSTNNLVFGVDFGNPKFNYDEIVNGISLIASGVSLNTTSSIGYVENTAAAGYLRYNSTKFPDLPDGFSAVIICSIAGFDGLSDSTYRGIIGTGNSHSTRLVNLWFQKSGSNIRLHQSGRNTSNNGFVGSFSSVFTPPATNEIVMVGYSHSVSSVTYYAHGSPVSTHSISDFNTAWPTDNYMYVSSGHNANSFYFAGGRIYTVLLYNRPLTATEHSSCYNTYKNRFGL